MFDILFISQIDIICFQSGPLRLLLLPEFFTNMIQLSSQHGYVITHTVKCGVKVFIRFLTKTIVPLKFWNK